MAEFRSWISSLSLWASSCSCALSCCILLMYSAVFCSVVALLICASRQGDNHKSATDQDYFQFFNITAVTIIWDVSVAAFTSHSFPVKLCINSTALWWCSPPPPFSTSISKAAHLFTVPLCLAESWVLSQDYVKCQNPVWCWNASSALRRCELSSWSLFAADNTAQKHVHHNTDLHTEWSYLRLSKDLILFIYIYIKKSYPMPCCSIWRHWYTQIEWDSVSYLTWFYLSVSWEGWEWGLIGRGFI